MKREAVSGIMLTMLLIGMLTLAFNIQPVKVESIERTNTVILEFDFPSPAVTKGPVYDSVTMPGLSQYGASGEPVLPFKAIKAVIPRGKDVQSVDVTAGNRKVLEGRFNVEYGKTLIPISSNTTVVDQPSQKIYSSANPFPSVLFSQMSEQHLRGYKILMLKLHPVQYIPKTGELSYFETMTVTVNTMASSNVSPLLRSLQQDEALILDIVDNPSEVESYTETTKLFQSTTLANPTDSYDYVIITNNALKSSFQPLIDWKIQKGLNATIVLVEDIMDDPDYHCDGLFGDGYGIQFNDTQAHVRNFIKDAYLNWGTEYVLLGGDDEIIPSRDVYCYAEEYTDYIPCDMYYGALDGSWDNDNDTIFGEGVYYFEGPENGTAGEEADFFAEVYIGRATVDNAEEATNFVNKTLAYEQNTNATYLKKALMIGETLDSITEGGNGKDLVTDIIPQYTTTRLYDRDGTFSRIAVIDEMNSGTHIVNHDGHAQHRSVMGLSVSDVDNLTNTEYFIAYSIGCYSAAFDNATSGFDEAIAEHFIFNSHGAFAYIGNSRYGWYSPGSTNGPGHCYDRSFFKVLRDGVRNVGKALQLSKEQEMWFHRWTYFTLNLLGDPETEIVTAIKAPTAHFETRMYLWTPPHIGGAVNLRGTAKRGTALGATFSNFTIEFSHGTEPLFWMTTGINLTNNGESEVVNGTLAVWNTNLVDNGPYTLRLTVSDVDGNVGKDWAIIIVTDLSIHNIDTGLDYRTMQEAINAPETSDGHTILVDEGKYYEHLVVSKSVSLIGENRSNTIIEGGNIGHIIRVTANNVTVSGFTIQNGGPSDANVYLEYSNYSRIINNIFIFTRGWLYGDYGVRLNFSYFNTISGNTITNKSCGIHLDESFFNAISGNNITENNGYGIWLDDSSNNILRGNSISNNDVNGIWLSGSPYNNISGNNITNNDYGIFLANSSDNFIYHNNFVNNTNQVNAINSTNVWCDYYPSGGNYWSNYNPPDLYSGPYQNETGSDGMGDTAYFIDANNTDNYPLIHLYGSIRNLNTSLAYLTIQSAINAPETLDGHTIFVSSGTYYEHIVVNKSVSLVGESRSTTIVDGNRTDSTFLVTSNNVSISGFTISRCGDDWWDSGIYVYFANDIIIKNNIFNVCGLYGGNGVYLENSSSVIVSDNLFKWTLGWSIRLLSSDHNAIENNVIKGTTVDSGILLDNSDGNSVNDNKIEDVQFGIWISHSSNNILNNNWVKDSIQHGLHLEFSHGNSVYHNNFLNNTIQLYSYNSTNTWDNGKGEGNYWSDYNGTDTNGDGVGDTYLPWQGVDYYPLMIPYIPGDANHDGYVNVWDLALLSDAWLTEIGEPNYNPNADFNEDGFCNVWDLGIMSDHWLQEV